MSYSGDCNKCGACCQYTMLTIDGNGSPVFVKARCDNLIGGDDKYIQYPKICAVHEERELGMPTKMRFPNGTWYRSQCLTVYPRPQDAIPPQCSYSWEGKAEQPKWNITYGPSM